MKFLFLLLLSLPAYALDESEPDFIALKHKAESGNLSAEFDIAEKYAKERGPDVDYYEKSAAAWYTKAANGGNIQAMSKLAYLYEVGRGVQESQDIAYNWYKKAAQQGDPAARDIVRYFNRTTKSLATAAVDERLNDAKHFFEDKQFPQALKLFTDVATAGNAEAERFLGIMYTDGLGAIRDEKTGFNWMKKAAEKSLPSAEFLLGTFYRDGIGVNKSREEAARWITAAADAGEPQAINELSKLSTLPSGPTGEIFNPASAPIAAKHTGGGKRKNK